jgi:hypothetical protein
MKRQGIGLRTYILTAVLFILAAVLAVQGVNSAEEASRREQVRTLRDSIRRAVVACYSAEGAYPESVEYLVENYGVRYDSGKFTVKYDIFASNIMPDYDVFIADGGSGELE